MTKSDLATMSKICLILIVWFRIAKTSVEGRQTEVYGLVSTGCAARPHLTLLPNFVVCKYSGNKGFSILFFSSSSGLPFSHIVQCQTPFQLCSSLTPSDPLPSVPVSQPSVCWDGCYSTHCSHEAAQHALFPLSPVAPRWGIGEEISSQAAG